MKEYKTNIIGINLLKKPLQAIEVILSLAVLLTACAPSLAQSNPTPQPVLESTPVAINDQMNSAISAAKFVLAEQLQLGMETIKLTDVQQVQWPDGCLGVQQPGIMCAMHVVDGYKITLSANDQTYEIRSNLDGSQIVPADGSTPNITGVSYTIRNGGGCQSFLIAENNGITYGPCDGKLKTVPFVGAGRSTELDHFVTTFKSFSFDLPSGTVELIGSGSTTPSADEQRSLSIWAKLVADETQAGRSSAASGLVIGWHREGGVGGFCDDLSIYETGLVDATSCKNGTATNLGQTWLDNEQLTQLYQWQDSWSRFELNTQTQAQADGETIHLIFDGNGSTQPTGDDQQTVESFAEKLDASMSVGSASPDISAQIVTDFLNSLKKDPSGKSSINDLSESIQLDLQNGDLLPDLVGIQNTYSSFGISSEQPVQGTDLTLVNVTLNYVSPISRSMVVANKDGSSLIDTFIRHNQPPMTPEDEFQKADQVILKYIQAMQNKDAVTAFSLLSPDGQNATPQDKLSAEMSGLQSISPISISLDKSGSSNLTYTVKLWVKLAGTNSSTWNDGENTRTFHLTKKDQDWQIDQIDSGN
jgi:hypothetical protein